MPASVAASAVLTASGGYVHSGVGPASNSAKSSVTAALSGSAVIGAPDDNSLAAFEFGVQPITLVPVAADIGLGPPFFTTTPLSIEPVPIKAFGSEGFEFGTTALSIAITTLDPTGSSGGTVGGKFEFGATGLALVPVPIQFAQTFAPFQLGTTPLTLTPVDAELFARPPATLAPSDSGIDLAPTTREFEPPRYAVTFERSMSGLTEAVLWGSKPGNAKMALGYETMADEFAEIWMKLYDESRELLPLSLPDEVYSGLSVELKNIYSLAKYGLSWFFTGPPTVESVTKGYSAVEIELEGRNARALPYSASGFLPPQPTIVTEITPPQEPYVPPPDGDIAPPVLPPSLDGATPVVPASIVYSQSSVYPGNTAATVATMQNATGSEATATCTNNDSLAYILMDLGAKRLINNVIVGSDYANTLAGGWGVAYSTDLDIEYSEDNFNWFFLANTGTFSSAIKTISGLSAAGRYIRIVAPNDYIAVTEFYATTD